MTGTNFMLTTIINIILGTAALGGVAVVIIGALNYLEAVTKKTTAEIAIATAQANHINQTAEVEKNTLEATIRAHEKNGANKLRTDIARNLNGDLEAIEKLLGSKITGAISLAAHEAQLAKSREIINDLEAQLDRITFAQDKNAEASVPVESVISPT